MNKNLELLNKPNLFTTCVLAILVDEYGSECLNWEPETIEIELRNNNIMVTDNLKDKIMAASVILTTDLVHSSATIFNNIIQVLNFSSISNKAIIPSSLDDILWGCLEIRMLEGKEDFNKQGFSTDISGLVASVLKEHGISDPPNILAFAEESNVFTNRRDEAVAADSTLSQMYWDVQKEMKAELNAGLKEKVDGLINQLKNIPFNNAQEGFITNLIGGSS